MSSLYKKPIVVTDPKSGQKIKTKSKKWWGRYRDENHVERRVPLAADKAAAQAMLNELVKKAERQAAGLVDRFDEHRKRPVGDHLTDFERHLKSKGVSSEQVKLVASRSRRIIEGCNAPFVGDISASRVQAFLADLREKGKSVQTSNHYLRAIKQFTRWLVKDRRASDDPLAHVAMLNVSMDRRHDRRPFSEAELAGILQAANTGPVVRRVKGPDRAMLYAVAGYTGLRASELASLKPQSFDLNADPSTVTVQAAYSKHRREDVLPLHPSLVSLLRPWLASKPADQPVWPGNWAKGKKAGAMLKHDLKAAEIAYVDESGRYADFHALRHTFITNMVKSGISPKAAQSLARHSTIDLTMNVYTSLTVHDQASALASLPPIPVLDGAETGAGALRATGTDGPEKVPTVVPRGAENGAVRLAPQPCESARDCTESGDGNGEAKRLENARNPGQEGASCVTSHQPASGCITEGKGFEPLDALRRLRFSRPVQSAALPPLRLVFSIANALVQGNATGPGLGRQANPPPQSRSHTAARRPAAWECRAVAAWRTGRSRVCRFLRRTFPSPPG
jgi:integrase